MTRPIQEPTGARTDASLGHMARQLQRRPKPESAGDHPYAYLARETDLSVLTGGANSVNPVAGADFEFTSDDNVFIPFPVTGRIAIQQEGLYTARLYGSWDGSNSNSSSQIQWSCGTLAQGTAGSQQVEVLAPASAFSVTSFEYVNEVQANNFIAALIINNSGVTDIVSYSYLVIMQHLSLGTGS